MLSLLSFSSPQGVGYRSRYLTPAAAGFGALQALSYSPQVLHLTTAWWLQWLGVISLVWLLRSASNFRQGALIGWAYGVAWLVVATGWLFISMHRYGDMPAILAALAVVALSAFLSLYLGIALGAFVALRRNRWLPDVLLFGALWLLAELARGVLLTGFPWASSGYAHVDSPLAVLAPWIGVYGIGALSAMAACLISLSDSYKRGIRSIFSVALILGTLSLISPLDFTHTSGKIPVTLLQANVPQNEKFIMAYLEQQLRWYGQALVDTDVGLVVAPETAIPVLPASLPDAYLQRISQVFSHSNKAALIGVPLGNSQSGYTNSAIGLVEPAAHELINSVQLAAHTQPVYRYDKHHLVPFGEFIPTGFHWFVRLMNMPLGDFERGSLYQPPFFALGQRIGPNICYEDVFGEELAARLIDAQSAPTIFANLSNIGWFGESLAVEQHLQMSRMRALELQRPMIRATNTGATVVIDYGGHVLASLEPYTRGILKSYVEGREGLTPFAWWAGRWSLWPLLIAAGLVILAIFRLQRQQYSSPN